MKPSELLGALHIAIIALAIFTLHSWLVRLIMWLAFDT
jgi:hypothetical protein